LLRRAANRRGIRLFGDLPMYVALDSADVWAHPELFRLDDDGRPTAVAGVPPDYFSDSGQLWGNPLYRWERHACDGFRWWRQRFRTQLDRFDLLRIDHFRGFQACWEVPAGSDDASAGRWQPSPGDRLFAALADELGELPLVAEDLGLITPEVDALRRRLGLPGMKVLQFAFDDGADNIHLPHHHEPCSVVYTGTHDNDTTLGWYQTLDEGRRRRVYGYLGMPGEDMPWALIRAAMASVARLSVLPMQDILALGSAHRMNRPGIAAGNWRWRFQWDGSTSGHAPRIRHLASVYDRLRE
jgi:4-alpha-glucanotransferase